jgi:hypothetical protein
MSCWLLFLCFFSEFPKSNGFLIIEANGGLNQQRLSVRFVSWNIISLCFNRRKGSGTLPPRKIGWMLCD